MSTIRDQPFHYTSYNLAYRVFELIQDSFVGTVGFEIFEYPFEVRGVELVYEVIYSIYLNSRIQPETLVCALKYLNDFLYRGGILFNQLTWYRTTVAILLVSAKMNDDFCPYSKMFATITCDISGNEMLQLEQRVCEVLDFRLFVTEEQYGLFFRAMKRVQFLKEPDMHRKSTADGAYYIRNEPEEVEPSAQPHSSPQHLP